MKKIFKIAGFVLLGLVFIGTLGFLYKKSQPESEIYDVKNPEVTTIVKKTVATGSIEPRKEIEVKPQVSGIVEELYVEAGTMVRKGDVLARVNIIPDMINLNNAESRMNRARMNYEDAKINYDRQTTLFEKEVIPREEYQRAQLSFNAAREEIDAAQNNLDLIRKGVTRSSAKTTNTLIRSTIDGMVLDVPVKEGFSVIQANTFNAGTTIAVVADMKDMIFIGKVDETEVGKIREGMHIELTIGAIDDETFDAVLKYIAPKGKIENGAIQFEIKADLLLKENQFIRSGYSANANIVLDRRDSVLTIPEATIKFQNDSAYVEVETETQKFEKRFVKTGLSDGINIEITEGLAKADKVRGEKIDPKAHKQS
ncbi:MAG: efflux RND transporter periplasmic adaptor subunit [Prolixibacteraceae bacterium]|jgi:HlyD family secretion protein|nr:efflux RND transporter periplasmic adaptor subunit [Prolixibacteraceae bacterium]MDI9562712.1 efflux RND transporter periplasmic adaptor subunit [Bacteroidota bacterium]NLS99657.1 efflux RND transporter periplasmic adaptor subunit [Bacteroidales bacterium]OQB81711.1 MAG: Multidrug resistance protein MdtA precursor [Bacteroidetes bacterium ADurb.Bin123]HNU77051.1 efflux RND transporter periplasmic adaptor subunit [Prolixibacteraceae bacterium]